MTKAGLYLRLSDEDRDKAHSAEASESIQNQLSMLRKYCAEKKWQIYDIYSDEDLSGADKSRPEFNRLIKDCEEGRIDVVLCKSQSRFSREMEMIEKYLHDKFIEWGVRFVSIVDHADTNDVYNKKARQINGLINEWYLEDVSENIRQTLKHKRENGEFTGSFAPYGYLIDPKNKNHLIIDKNTAPIVRRIFEMYNQGWGYRKIVMELNGDKIPSPTVYKKQNNSNYRNSKQEQSRNGGLWTVSTVYRLIRNEMYTGTLVQGKSHSISYKNKKRRTEPRNNWIRVPDSHEAIIDEETWQITCQRLRERSRISRKSLELPPLSGKVKCALCGAPMVRNVYYNKDKTVPRYTLRCSTYASGTFNCENKSGINGQALENIIADEINKLISEYCVTDEICITDFQEEKKQRLCDRQSEFERMIEQCQNKIETAYGDRLEGLLDKDQYVSLKRKYDSEIAVLERKREEIGQRLSELEKTKEKADSRQEILNKYTHVKKLTRDITDELIDEIRIGEKTDRKERDVIIDWRF